MNTTIEITRNESTLLVEVTGNYNPGLPGSRDSMGVPESPDDIPCFEDIQAVVVEDATLDHDPKVITFKAGECVTLTPEEEREANRLLLGSIN